ncbi:MAG: ATP-binding protein [Bacteroidaceae bacterium]|nr:ATP-binding protein [Bacteroidaceae bacterium]
MKIERPSYMQQLIESKDNGLIKIVTGLRRVGKSYLLKTLFKEYLLNEGVRKDHVLIIDLEDRKQNAFRDPDYLLDWVDRQMQNEEQYYIIIDEVQKVDEFVDMLGSLAIKENADVYVTGSNSHFLSSDIATEFRGRGDEIHVWPLSFKEYMTAYDGDVYDGWQEYYTYGGLPKILSIKGDDKKATYLRNLYRTVYLSDIYERHEIENKAEFEELVRILASSVGSPVNPTNLANTFKTVKRLNNITDKTIETYVGYLEDAFMIEKAERYDVKGKKYVGTTPKYYFKDLGLRNAILSFRQTEENHLMENIIYNEMRHRGFLVDVGNVYVRMKNEKGDWQRVTLEVDFVCNLGSRRYYLQSAYRLPDEEKIQQERRSLTQIADSFKKIVVVGERMKLRRDDIGIVWMGIYEFLADEKMMDV